MNQRISKLLRKWCKARKYDYEKSKLVYNRADTIERDQIAIEMKTYLMHHISMKENKLPSEN